MTTPPTRPTPPLRTRDLARLFQLRDLLTDVVLHECGGRPLEGAAYRDLVRHLWENLPPRVDRAALEDSVRHLAGSVLDRDGAAELCWRLAGNVDRLRGGRAVPPWVCQRDDEWVPLELESCRPERRRDAGAVFGLRVLAGTPCPRLLWRWLSERQCRWLLAPLFGFSRPPGRRAAGPPPYPYARPAQLVRMRCYGLVDAARSAEAPVVTEFRAPAGLADRNHRLLRWQYRCDPGYACPEGRPRSFPCYLCPAGYLRCAGGRHRLDWRAGPCAGCGREAAYFDPELPAGLCVDCYHRAARHGKEK